MLASIILSLTLVAASPAKTRKHPAPKPQAALAPSPPRDSTASEPDSLFEKVMVNPSQTLSWLGLRHFGAWTPEIASQVIKDNPSLIKSPLIAGQTLRLRRQLDRRSLSPAQQIAMASHRAVVTRLFGAVDRISSDGQIHPLAADEFVQAGDRIRTGPKSMVELIIDNQSILRVRANSQLELVRIQDSGKLAAKQAGTQVKLSLGRVWTKVRKWAGPLVGFEVRMPQSIAGVHGTIFECQANPDLSSQVWVDEGVVGVRKTEADTSETVLTRGQSALTDPTGRIERAENQDLPDPTDLLPDPSPDARNHGHEDIRSTLQQILAQREFASELAASFPGHDTGMKAPRRIR